MHRDHCFSLHYSDRSEIDEAEEALLRQFQEISNKVEKNRRAIAQKIDDLAQTKTALDTEVRGISSERARLQAEAARIDREQQRLKQERADVQQQLLERETELGNITKRAQDVTTRLQELLTRRESYSKAIKDQLDPK